MKKRFVVFAIIIVICSFLLIACSRSAPQNEDALEVSNFEPIEEAQTQEGKNY